MKVLTNLECMTPPLTGIGHYTRQLLPRLAIHQEVLACQGIYRNRCLDAAQIIAWLSLTKESRPSSTNGWKVQLRQKLRGLPAGYTLRHLMRIRRFAAIAQNCEDHVYWEPGLELAPFAKRRVAMIYDLSHIAIPESHPPSRVDYLSRQVSHTLRHADGLVTISETMRTEIAAHSGRPASEIHVVTPAADAAFRPLEQEEKRATRQRLGLPEQFILSLGTLEPRKNLLRLAHAYERLPASTRQRWPLVCIGGKGWNDSALIEVIERLERRGELIRMGYVAQHDLPAITATADLLAYPSLYEGFGMPVVEAMACGVPILTSRGTAMQEITGDSAFLIEPRDVDDLYRGLEAALESPSERQRLGQASLKRARRYDWEISTERLVEALQGKTIGSDSH